MERMAEVVPDTDEQRLQHFLSESPWDHRNVMDHVAQEANTLLGGRRDSALLIDETSFKKSGTSSVGSARQYCGRLGKVDVCQVAVFGILSDGDRYVPIDTRLYLPKEWVSHPVRCRKAGVPDAEIVLRSKAQHALEIVRHARKHGLRFGWVGFDGGYGKEPWLLRELDRDSEIFVADIHKDQVVYFDDPKPTIPERKSWRGHAPRCRQAQTEGIRVDKWLAGQPKEAWQRVTLRNTTRGALTIEIIHRRVWVWNGEEESAHCWHLIVRREVKSPETIKYSFSNAPHGTPTERLAFMQGQRYWVERSFQDAKGDCGMADYQVRKWTGWHHHMAMVMIAMLFMAEERSAQQNDLPLLSGADIVSLLKHFWLILDSRVLVNDVKSI
jgi:SRSO17 transposase